MSTAQRCLAMTGIILLWSIAVTVFHKPVVEPQVRGIDPVGVSNFVWEFDSSEGIAVKYQFVALETSADADGTTRIFVRMGEQIRRHWEVLEARAYVDVDGVMRRTSDEGPYRAEDASRSDETEWLMRKTRHQKYVFELLLHRKSQRLTYQQTESAIRKSRQVELRVALASN